jgi:uncharacterized protein (TIGR00369 family)
VSPEKTRPVVAPRGNEEAIRAFLGAAEATPLREAVGLSWQNLDPVRMTQVVTPSARFLDTEGALSMGALAVLADSTAGSAGAVNGGYWFGVTLGLRIELARPLPVPAVEVLATASVIRADAAESLVTAMLTDREGVGLGYASMRGLGLDRRSAPESERDSPRPPRLAPTVASGRGTDTGLGFVVEAKADRGRSRLVVEPDPVFASGTGRLHGGIVAALVHQGGHHAIASSTQPGERVLDLVLDVDFIRPVPPGGSLLKIRAKVSSRTRRYAWAEGRVLLPDGRTAARGRILAAISPTA